MTELIHNGRTYISVLEAAKRKGCHPETIKRYIRRGRLAAIRLSRSLLAVDIEALNSLRLWVPLLGVYPELHLRRCDICGGERYYRPSEVALVHRGWRRCRECVSKYGLWSEPEWP